MAQREDILERLAKRGIKPVWLGVGGRAGKVLQRAIAKVEAGERRPSRFTHAQRRELGQVTRELRLKEKGFKRLVLGLRAIRDRETEIAKKHHPPPTLEPSGRRNPEAARGDDPVAALRRAFDRTDGGARVFYKDASGITQKWTTEGFIRFVSLPHYKIRWDKVFGRGKFYFATPTDYGDLPEGARPTRFRRPKA